MIEVKFIAKELWNETFSELAHGLVFKEHKPKEWDRIDFALLVLLNGIPSGYMTCREYSHDTIYVQYGGTFGEAKNSIWSYRILESLMDYFRIKYARCLMFIENTNKTMLKMSAKIGFKIIGVRNYHNDVLLEHLLELHD